MGCDRLYAVCRSVIGAKPITLADVRWVALLSQNTSRRLPPIRFIFIRWTRLLSVMCIVSVLVPKLLVMRSGVTTSTFCEESGFEALSLPPQLERAMAIKAEISDLDSM